MSMRSGSSKWLAGSNCAKSMNLLAHILRFNFLCTVAPMGAPKRMSGRVLGLTLVSESDSNSVSLGLDDD